MMLWQVLALLTALYSLESSAILWPAGTYGIPKPVSGCPLADGFQWKEGWILQDTNYYTDHNKSNNSRSPEFHLDGKVDKIIVNRSFCIKDINDNNIRPAWPAGKYCIYKKNGHCPQGLTKGWVFWNDDGDSVYNGDKRGGTLPDGLNNYPADWDYTEIHFCCKTNGNKNHPVLLPSKSPFFLLAYESAKCQMVKWALASLEWIYYFTTDNDNDDQRHGAFPYDAGKMHPTIYYCYYHGCNETLRSGYGTLKSPCYPKKYPNGQYCSWKITVRFSQIVHLMFTAFLLQKENNTDELYVYDGENESGNELGVFFGGHIPPEEGIYSSSNNMFLIFKSDETDSYTGFNAFYYAVNICSSATTTVLHTSDQEVTPSSDVTSTSTKTPEMTSSYVGSPTTTQSVMLKPPSTVRNFNVVAVVAPVVSVVLLAGLVTGAFCYWKRKKRKLVAGPEDSVCLTMESESAALVENTDV